MIFQEVLGTIGLGKEEVKRQTLESTGQMMTSLIPLIQK